MAKTNDATKKVSAEALKAIRKTATDLSHFESENTAKASKVELNRLVGRDLSEETAAEDDRALVAKFTMDLMDSIKIDDDMFDEPAAVAVEEPIEAEPPGDPSVEVQPIETQADEEPADEEPADEEPVAEPIEAPVAHEPPPRPALHEPSPVVVAPASPEPDPIEMPRARKVTPDVIKVVAVGAAVLTLILLLIALQPHVG